LHDASYIGLTFMMQAIFIGDRISQSVARGTFGAPTFLVGDEILFGKDRLREVEEAILDGVGSR
jgi:2-hydroxychromene-2-carboxylate isomerase